MTTPVDELVPVLKGMPCQDGAVGWSLAIGLESALITGHLPEATAAAIYGAEPRAVLAGSIQPRGRAVAVDGGYRVSGRWPFAGGFHHASWIMGTCIIYDSEGEHLDAQCTAQPEPPPSTPAAVATVASATCTR
jgi:indole-3-acetate monooxygenase